MQYLPSTIWRKGDKDRAAAMIQVIEKMLKTRRIMRSLEKFDLMVRGLNSRSLRLVFMWRLVEIFVMVDVARGSRLGAWLRACCLFILPNKSRGVFRSSPTLVLEFLFR
uniref:Uncharacterized protein n=1 Tax=Tanacetum cinerariifolium TaxID=118510 RepID=A0A699GRU5_TANCI|nr:hypothetical protein [Tanacetum cinerariifolium]